jgi:hypothetical protein
MTGKTLAARIGITLFVALHMTGVAAYALPSVATNPAVTWVRGNVHPYTMVYVLLLSQWQQWNMFAPDPLRRVETYAVEVDDARGQARTVEIYDARTYPWWRHAARFKLYGNLFEDAGRQALFDVFLAKACARNGIAEGRTIRLVYNAYVIPQHAKVADMGWWKQYRPAAKRVNAVSSVCPPR